MIVRNVECEVRNGRAGVDSAFRTPYSALAVKHRGLVRGSGRSESEMPVRGSCGTAAARRAREKALLHQEGLVHLLERAGVLAHGGGDGREAYRPALELLDDGLQDPAVHVVEAELVHVEPFERLARDRRGNLAPGPYLRVVAHPLQEPVCDTRRAATAAGDLGYARGIGRDVEDTGRAADDLGQVVGRVVREPLHQAAPRAPPGRPQDETR